MQNIAIIIQARLGSTRLSNKMILPFWNGKSIFELLLSKLNENFENIPIILATSTNSENDILESIAKKNGLLVFRGDENDVLQRFISACDFFKIKHCIRVCADNPFLDVKELKNILDFAENNTSFDYINFNVNNIPSIKTHFGFWTEYVTLAALKKVNTLTKEKLYHEHVTNYIYENPEKFQIYFLSPNMNVIGRTDIRMTLDTIVDFQVLSELYGILSEKYVDFGIDEIISFLDNNSQYSTIMNVQMKNNVK